MRRGLKGESFRVFEYETLVSVACVSIRSISGIPARDYRAFHISTMVMAYRYTVRGDVEAYVLKAHQNVMKNLIIRCS